MIMGIFPEKYCLLKLKGVSFDRDESVKSRLTTEKLSRFKPLLIQGSITVGNSCMKNDGAVLILVMEEKLAINLGFAKGLKFIESCTVGVDPNYLGIGPVPAVRKLLKRAKVKIEDIDTIELNEAFSSACQKELSISDDKLNRWGRNRFWSPIWSKWRCSSYTIISYECAKSVEDSVMQYYLRDGEEHQRVIFKEKRSA